LIVEESLSFGVLGKRGAGLADHFGMDPKCIDIMASSMAHTLAAGGGFCAGSKEVVDHQVLFYTVTRLSFIRFMSFSILFYFPAVRSKYIKSTWLNNYYL
jgi:hypothetical protein